MSIATHCRSAALVLALLAVPLAASAEEAQPEQLIDGLNGVFGKHAGKRASHAKGICVKGTFTPTAEAAALTKSPQFAAPVPIVGRFSLGGGNPMASDGQKDNARGFALHYNLPDGGTTDLMMISSPVFLAKTPEVFLDLLRTIAPGPDGKKDKPRSMRSSRLIPRARGLVHGSTLAPCRRATRPPTISGCTRSS